MDDKRIFFEQIRSSGCLSYFFTCKKEKASLVIDPEIDKAEEYLRLAKELDAPLIYVIDTHTHADHSSACKILRDRVGARVVMHQASEAPYVDLRVNEGNVIRCWSEAAAGRTCQGETLRSNTGACEDWLL